MFLKTARFAGPTWRSHGTFKKGGEDGENRRHACLDHIYASVSVDHDVAVLDDSTTDHRPVLATVRTGQTSEQGTTKLIRRNYKAIKREDLVRSLDRWDWSKLYGLSDVEAIHKHIIEGITSALSLIHI